MDYITIMQVVMTIFVIAMVAYFLVDIIWLAHQNDRLKERLNRIEQRVKELER